jgi:hypothetical protein
VQWFRDQFGGNSLGKLRDTIDNVHVGQIVLLRDDCYLRAKWPLGHIVEVHTSPDALFGVATVKITTNTFRRHVARVRILSLEEPKVSGPT